MPDVMNEDLATANPSDPSKAYDAKHGKYQPDTYPLEDTAANASPEPERKDPWKGMGDGK